MASRLVIETIERKTINTKFGAKTQLIVQFSGEAETRTGFENQSTMNWSVGQEVEVELYEKGVYKNFKPYSAENSYEAPAQVRVSPAPVSDPRIDALEDRIRKLEMKVFVGVDSQDDINDDPPPFY